MHFCVLVNINILIVFLSLEFSNDSRFLGWYRRMRNSLCANRNSVDTKMYIHRAYVKLCGSKYSECCDCWSIYLILFLSIISIWISMFILMYFIIGVSNHVERNGYLYKWTFFASGSCDWFDYHCIFIGQMLWIRILYIWHFLDW